MELNSLVPGQQLRVDLVSYFDVRYVVVDYTILRQGPAADLGGGGGGGGGGAPNIIIQRPIVI